MKIQKRRNHLLFGVLTFGTLTGALVGGAILSPAPMVSANETVSGGTAVSTSTQVTLNLAPMISIELEESNIDLEITPSTDGQYASGTATVKVDTNALDGYKVYVSTKTSETALSHESATSTINMIDTDVSLADYQAEGATTYNNTWGYVHDETVSAFTGSLDTVICSEDTLTADVATCNFAVAVRADNSIPSGDYSNTVVFTAITN